MAVSSFPKARSIHAHRQTGGYSIFRNHFKRRVRTTEKPPPFPSQCDRRCGGGQRHSAGWERVGELFEPRIRALAGTKLDTVKSPLSTTGETLTSLDDITHYNNFYEFGTDKGDPSKNAGGLPTRPWTIKVDGQVKNPKTFDIEALLKLRPLEDRSTDSAASRRGAW